MALLKRLFKDESGVTLIEYALIALLIAIALVTFLGDVGEIVNGFYESVGDAFP